MCLAGLLGTAPAAYAATQVAPILSASQAMPAEFQADTLLLVVARQRAEEGGSWPANRSAAMANLEKVYSLGFNAPTKFPLRPVATASEEAHTRSLSVALDRISLQIGAAREMVALDPVRAMSIFARDEKLVPVVAACGAREFEDYSKIYDVAARLLALQTTPDPKFIEERMDRAKSPTSLAPILRIANGERFEANGLYNIMRWTSDALRRIKGNDQAFSASLGDVDAEIAAFQRLLADKGVDDGLLKQAYATYLNQNLTGPRCAENLKGLPAEIVNAVVEGRRAELGLTLPAAPDEPDSIPTEQPPTPPEALAIQAAELITAMKGDELGGGILSGAALETKANDFLNAVDAAARLQDDAASSIYKARIDALVDYLDHAPEGAQRTRARQNALALIVNSPLYTRDRIDWFYGLKRLFVGMEVWPERDAELQKLAASANPVVRTYAMLAREGMIDPVDQLAPTALPATP
jgi:hypothetical protein